MTTETILNICIDICPEELDSNISNHLLSRINKPFCNQNTGYMLEVLEIINFESSPLIRGANPSFNVTYKAKILKPEEGKVLDAKVKMIFSQGVILEFYGMEICVPKSDPKKEKKKEDFILNVKEKNFVYKKKTYKLGDILKVKINKFDYEKHAFICLANFV